MIPDWFWYVLGAGLVIMPVLLLVGVMVRARRGRRNYRKR